MKYWFSLLIKSQGKRLYWGILWASITMLAGVALLMLSGWFITATAITGLAISAGIMLMFDMYMPGSGIRFFALTTVVGRYTERVYNHDTVLRLIATFRVSIFERLMQLPMQELRASSDSEWLGKLTADLDALDNILLRYTITPIASACVIAIITFFLSFIWPNAALVLGIFFFGLYSINVYTSIRYTKDFANASSHMLNNLRGQIISHVQGAVELQAQHLMQHHEQFIFNHLQRLDEVQNKLNNRIANLQLVLDLCLGTGLVVLVATVLYVSSVGQLSGPVAVLFVMMYMGITELIQIAPAQFGSWGHTKFAANRLGNIYAKTQSQGRAELEHITAICGRISHHPNIPKSAHNALEFALSKQQMLLVLGRSGEGKSTFANLLSGITKLNNAQSFIHINNTININELNPSHWHKNIVYLEQSNTLLAGSLGYNLALGLINVNEEQIWTVLKTVELDEWASNLPDGLNTWLGESGGHVSGGQARRLCLARLLLRDPQLVILDEPFNGLDAEMASRIWGNISEWLQNRMLVLFSHEQPSYISVQPEHCVLDLNANVTQASL